MEMSANIEQIFCKKWFAMCTGAASLKTINSAKDDDLCERYPRGWLQFSSRFLLIFSDLLSLCSFCILVQPRFECVNISLCEFRQNTMRVLFLFLNTVLIILIHFQQLLI